MQKIIHLHGFSKSILSNICFIFTS
ncbi:unnamed protein product [Spirodela intermedia]|uniref:Uncharacterized protein n=1 Tax=Spirodela intermedia TaxID=51605 RepID=A0A7I8LEB2_SPIIN|nr:unnamed protein product [Spirodela intermedia]